MNIHDVLSELPLQDDKKNAIIEIDKNFKKFRKKLDNTLFYFLSNRFGEGKREITLESLGYNINIFKMIIDFLKSKGKYKKHLGDRILCKLPKKLKPSDVLPSYIMFSSYEYLFNVLDSSTYPLISIFDREHRDFYLNLVTDPFIIYYHIEFGKEILKFIRDREVNILVIGNEFFLFPIVLEHILPCKFELLFFSKELPALIKTWYSSFKKRTFYCEFPYVDLKKKLGKTYELIVGFLPFSFLGRENSEIFLNNLSLILSGKFIFFNTDNLQSLFLPFGLFDEFIYYDLFELEKLLEKFSLKKRRDKHIWFVSL
ncbi:MAG: hypothetical protein J7L07_03750 [Candidatus Odinarchaeota archaeon]|nr:hypothetical protein [Candidatus Odinarchaeota archaeon]